MQAQWQSTRPEKYPQLPAAWSASVLATPFGDSIAPRQSVPQLAVAKVESATVGFRSWMRVKLYLTQDLLFFDFLFVSVYDPNAPFSFRSRWYWIDSGVSGQVNNVYGPFETTVRVPHPLFLKENHAIWGNSYPLMCTRKNPKGIPCDHWVIASPGAQADHGSWYSVLKNTGHVARIFTMDSNNPMMLPFLGAFYMANFASFKAGVSAETEKLVEMVKQGHAVGREDYWNPMVSQQDVLRAFAFPLAKDACTLADIRKVLPGFSLGPKPGTPLPQWSKKLYIEGWAVALDLIPYRVRVCYDATQLPRRKQQSVFIGFGENPGAASYFKRTDTCLSHLGTDTPFYQWSDGAGWGDQPKYCLPPPPPPFNVPAPYPDWLARSGAMFKGRIEGNPDFGLARGESLNIVSAENPGANGQLGTFWAWFFQNQDGMIFAEGNYMNSLSHTLQLLDYTVFQRNAPVAASDFSDPCSGLQKQPPKRNPPAVGHFMHPGRKRRL
jgi:hypothetical protein